jgi:gliding motility-associated-like protein
MDSARRLIATILILIPYCFTYGQTSGQDCSWNFGLGAGLNFSQAFPDPFQGSQMRSVEGCSCISDKTGNLVLYTDGRKLWNGQNQLITDALAGSEHSTQSSLILRKPESKSLYYIFTIDEVDPTKSKDKWGNGLSYSVFNTETNSFEPDLHNRSLMMGWLNGCTEKITAVRHLNGKDYWIIAHEIKLSVFKIFLLTSNGLINQPDQIVGLDHHIEESSKMGAQGYLKGSPKGDRIALAIEGIRRFEVFKFDNATGTVSNPIQIDENQGEIDFGAFGLEFSPTGNYLYGSNRQDGIIYRWNIESVDPQIVKTSRQVIRQQSDVKCGALQLASNDKIYVAMEGKSYLGVIASPDLEDCRFNELGASLTNPENGSAGISGFGLPNLPADYFRQDIYFANNCSGGSTTFYLASNDVVDNPPEWQVDGNPIETDPNTYHGTEFLDPGEHFITLIGSKNSERVQFSRPIRIHPKPILQLTDNTALCTQSIELITGNWAFWSWSDGTRTDTTRFVSELKSYTVIVVNYEGCTSNPKTTQVVQGQQPEIDWDKTIIKPSSCDLNDDGSIELVMKGDLADYQFNWLNSSSTTNFRENLAAQEYEVIITSVTTGCNLAEKITVPFRTLEISIDRDPGDLILCPGTPIRLSATGAVSYEWEHEPGITQSWVIVSPDKSNKYKVTGYNGKCFGSDSIDIQIYSNNDFDLGKDRSICDGNFITYNREDFIYADNYINWEWSTGQTSDNIRIEAPLLNNRLSLTVTDNNNCKYTHAVQITFNARPAFESIASPITCSGRADGIIEIIVQEDPSNFDYSINDGQDWTDQNNYSGLKAGVYSVRVKGQEQSGCISEPQQLEINEPEPIQFLTTIRRPLCEDCSDGELRIYDISGGTGTPPYILNWDKEVLTDNTFVLSNLKAGTYTFTVDDENRCGVPQSIVIQAGDFFIPNAFSPNTGGDRNQKWILTSLEGWTNSLVQVFDRSGKMVFESDGEYSNPWDGTFMNQGTKNLPAGTYFFLIKIDKSDISKPIQRGTVTIVR